VLWLGAVLAKVQSAGVLGVEAYRVCVEVDVALGLPAYHLVGLGASAVVEGGVRVRSALKHSGWNLPPRRVTVNLAPADVRKDGAAFDLPIAVGILAAHDIIPPAALDGVLMLGELSLDGSLRRVAGGLPVALHARSAGVRALVLPRACAGEAASLTGLSVLAADSLPQVAAWLTGAHELQPAAELPPPPAAAEEFDLADVRGLEYPRLALEVAAAGGHNLLFIGAPGAGKSMLARRLPTILPPLSEDEALETSAIYSAAGLMAGAPIIRSRPFRSPHHDVSSTALVGGGSYPRPGEISLSHNGVLFLDELPEFRRTALEALRQPLEDRSITIVRTAARVKYPASFALVAAMNPCPCGYFGSELRACTCNQWTVRRYRNRISGPMLDRFDLQVLVPQTDYKSLSEARQGEPSAQVRERVVAARAIQQQRLKGSSKHSNAQLGPREIARWCALPDKTSAYLGKVVTKRGLTARGVHRLLRVARTLADLAGHASITHGDVASAIDFRSLDQEAL
jgi:magnesium chelatase family protein